MHDHNAHDNHDAHAQHQQSDRHAGHGAHGEMFKHRFYTSLVLAIPVVLLSPMIAGLLGYTLPDNRLVTAIPAILGTIIYVHGGSPFLTGAFRELRDRQPGMMTLIGMAITVAFLASAATTLGIGGLHLDFWWELALLIVIMLLGHWLEMRALGSASGALDALASMIPDTAERIEDDGTREVPIAELAVGDHVLVRAGGRVPADGTIESGHADMDESLITGESRSVPREAGDRVVAGTVATDNSVHVTITAIGDDTALAGIQRLVADAQQSSSRAQALADRAAALLFYFAITAAVLTFTAWMIAGSLDDAVVRTVTVLVIACPHALGLAIPLVIAISTERAARAGVLVKDRLALERMRTVDTVLFDKTGTLTTGEHRVTGIEPEDSEELLRIAAAAESESEHPVARAIAAAARERRIDVPRATDHQTLAGRGVTAQLEGRRIAVAGPALLDELGIEPDQRLEATIEEWKQRGASVLHVLDGDRILGVLALEDAIRPESRDAVDALHADGIRVVMITGDAREVAESVADRLGIDEVFAGVLPDRKESRVRELQERGHVVAMVGDGVNDAPALARADVGIAIGAGTDVAIESAGVVLAADDPRLVVSVKHLSRAAYRKMRQNLVWAVGYNIVAVPLAAGVLAPVGIVMPPAVGAILMSLSTIVVALNAQLLRRVELDPGQARDAAARSPERVNA
ncbi:copper-translocating P-type ATPase [Hoyosella sp. G463]|uniref:Copper-translocating P-type ATPase n=1 Tax=Lolliginicoccus lacisalsi TaxID=2742202 RepID=A0A927PN13_9ACTN|nr:copper-translocating P-type ATPase [Lolliginicoccus lacisalsi]MBD8507574.1 copper-translocating P-type ATPase [Lolliginicoccus lacisalsi]